MKQIDFTPVAGMPSGYPANKSYFVRDPSGQIWESFEGVWTNA
jgi:hypothetical protein